MKKLNYKVLVITLLLCLLLISVGYASYSTLLKINSSSSVIANNWSIHYVKDSIKLDLNNTAEVSEDGTPKVTNDLHNVTFALKLDVNTKYSFYVDVINDGTFDGELTLLQISTKIGDKTPSISSTNEWKNDYLKYVVTYLDGTDVLMGDTILSNEKKTLKVTVEYNQPELHPELLPDKETTFTFNMRMDYTQSSKLKKGEEVLLNIPASEVEFTPSDPNWKVTNVQEAIDYLYNN